MRLSSTGDHVRRVCVVSVVMLQIATWAVATGNTVNSVPPSNRSKTDPPLTDTGDDMVEDKDKEWYHWVVTRGGELANDVSDVDDPDELSRYSEFDVIIKQRRKRKLLDDDVSGLAVNASSSDRGKLASDKV